MEGGKTVVRGVESVMVVANSTEKDPYVPLNDDIRARASKYPKAVPFEDLPELIDLSVDESDEESADEEVAAIRVGGRSKRKLVVDLMDALEEVDQLRGCCIELQSDKEELMGDKITLEREFKRRHKENEELKAGHLEAVANLKAELEEVYSECDELRSVLEEERKECAEWKRKYESMFVPDSENMKEQASWLGVDETVAQVTLERQPSGKGAYYVNNPPPYEPVGSIFDSDAETIEMNRNTPEPDEFEVCIDDCSGVEYARGFALPLDDPQVEWCDGSCGQLAQHELGFECVMMAKPNANTKKAKVRAKNMDKGKVARSMLEDK